MRATYDRDFAARELDIEHAEIRALIDALTDEQAMRPDTIRYGLYAGQRLSFKDLLAHLICYEALTLEALADWREGRKHALIDGLRDDSAGMRIHFEGIAARADHPLPRVLADWERIQADIVREIRAMSDADWKSPPPFANPYPLDLGGVFEIILCTPPRPPYRHLPVHIPDAEAYLRRMRQN